MAKPVLSLAYGRNTRVDAILDGEVEVEGIEIIPSDVHMSELAWRQLRHDKFVPASSTSPSCLSRRF